MLLPPALASDKAVGCLWRVVQHAIIILIRCGDSKWPTCRADLISQDKRLFLSL
jgi:hypothetical protein